MKSNTIMQSIAQLHHVQNYKRIISRLKKTSFIGGGPAHRLCQNVRLGCPTIIRELGAGCKSTARYLCGAKKKNNSFNVHLEVWFTFEKPHGSVLIGAHCRKHNHLLLTTLKSIYGLDFQCGFWLLPAGERLGGSMVRVAKSLGIWNICNKHFLGKHCLEHVYLQSKRMPVCSVQSTTCNSCWNATQSLPTFEEMSCWILAFSTLG